MILDFHSYDNYYASTFALISNHVKISCEFNENPHIKSELQSAVEYRLTWYYQTRTWLEGRACLQFRICGKGRQGTTLWNG